MSLSACRHLILRHPITVSGETATCAQVVAERANTVGLLLVRHKRIKPGSALLPNTYLRALELYLFGNISEIIFPFSFYASFSSMKR